MKNILVTIDLSEYAQQVALYTAELAKLAQARIILLYAYNPVLPGGGEEEADFINERCVQAHLDKLARKIYRKTKVSVTRLVKPGIVDEVLFEVSRKVKADVIVICHQKATESDLGVPTPSLDARKHCFSVLSVSSISNPDPETIKPALAALINMSGHNSSPLVAAV